MSKQHKGRHSRSTRIIITIVSSLLAVIGIACIGISAVGMHLINRIHFTKEDPPYDPNITLPADEEEDLGYVDPIDTSVYENAASLQDIPLRGNEAGVRHILLLGIDEKTFVGRSDAMILLSINDKSKTIKLLSFQRDTFVSVPGRDMDADSKDDICKLNESYAFGRFDLLSKTIAHNFRLTITDYIAVNFRALPVIIDTMGGLDIQLTKQEMTQIPAADCRISVRNPGFRPLTGQPGVHHLNGFQTLEYARIRKIDSDFKRTQRQRHVIDLLIKKAQTMSYTQKLSTVYMALEHIDTNLSPDNLIQLAANSLKYRSYAILHDYSIPKETQCKGVYLGKKQGLQLMNPQQLVTDLHHYIYS